MMRRKSPHTTHVKNKQPLSVKVSRGAMVAAAAVMVIATPIQFSKPAAADKYDDQIAALQQQIDSENSQIAALSQQAQTYQVAVQQLQAQEQVIQQQITLAQAQYNQLTEKITETQQQIQTDKGALGQTLADLYVDGNTSTLEMLASSKNISDYLDKQQYQDSIRNQLTSTITQIQTLETQLLKQQQDAKVQLTNEQTSQAALVAKQQEQQNLLNQTQGQESNYQAMIASNQAQQQKLAQEQIAAMAATARATGGATVITGGNAASGGYPWNNSNCPMQGWMSTGGVDGSGSDGYGYGCRQCASYAAWRMAKETGVYPVNWGSAIDFPSNAQAAGYTVNSTPSAGSLAVMSVAQSGNSNGHIAWVDSYDASTGQVVVSQYNYYYPAGGGNGWGNYTEMAMSASAFTWYIHVSGN